MPIRIMHNIQGEYYMQTMHIYAQYSGEYNMHNIQGSTICTIFRGSTVRKEYPLSSSWQRKLGWVHLKNIETPRFASYSKTGMSSPWKYGNPTMCLLFFSLLIPILANKWEPTRVASCTMYVRARWDWPRRPKFQNWDLHIFHISAEKTFWLSEGVHCH